MSHARALTEQEVTDSTGARTVGGESGGTLRAADNRYEVQLDGLWVEVDHDSYERVRQIQDSCA